MKCIRCAGFMNSTAHYDHECSQTFIKCLNCGEIIDSVILKNRGIDLKKFNRKKQPRKQWSSKIYREVKASA